ncbi:MAG: tRNA lysidine(34) synthetase TilS [Bacteroidetes bacterium]|nr:tRNA lysidine(34) synthetase TilS [Bacteroidota bacterium]
MSEGEIRQAGGFGGSFSTFVFLIFYPLVEAFQKFIAKEKLPGAEQRTLIAASAGVDSTVLCHLFFQSGLPFVVAHCNFQLRGAASDEDEIFVKKLAENWRTDFHSTRFDTVGFAEKNKLSIQQAARQLRYEWLEEIRQLTGCQHVATAHHLDDSIETVLYNFVKGCGLRGLHGIFPKKGHLIRPLLFATKHEILDFATTEGIAWREDESNRSDKYTRNKIRQQVVPVFEKINPAFQKTAGETIVRLREAEQLYDFALQTIAASVVEKQGKSLRIDLQKLRTCPAPATVLFEVLKPCGFNNDQVGQILQSAENQSGKFYHSPTHRLLVDRVFLVVTSGQVAEGGMKIQVASDAAIEVPGAKFRLTVAPEPPAHFPKEANLAWLDAGKLSFPLTLRHWQPGDFFCPLGMGGRRQKLQDFFSNQKLSIFDKEKTWLLESGGEIAWVVGMRLDERFKVTQQTKQYLRIDFSPE